jgi:hypothetical protein
MQSGLFENQKTDRTNYSNVLLPSILKAGNEAAKSMRSLPGEFNLGGYKSVSRVNNNGKITVGNREEDEKRKEALENLKT